MNKPCVSVVFLRLRSKEKARVDEDKSDSRKRMETEWREVWNKLKEIYPRRGSIPINSVGKNKNACKNKILDGI